MLILAPVPKDAFVVVDLKDEVIDPDTAISQNRKNALQAPRGPDATPPETLSKRTRPVPSAPRVPCGDQPVPENEIIEAPRVPCGDQPAPVPVRTKVRASRSVPPMPDNCSWSPLMNNKPPQENAAGSSSQAQPVRNATAPPAALGKVVIIQLGSDGEDAAKKGVPADGASQVATAAGC